MKLRQVPNSRSRLILQLNIRCFIADQDPKARKAVAIKKKSESRGCKEPHCAREKRSRERIISRNKAANTSQKRHKKIFILRFRGFHQSSREIRQDPIWPERDHLYMKSLMGSWRVNNPKLSSPAASHAIKRARPHFWIVRTLKRDDRGDRPENLTYSEALQGEQFRQRHLIWSFLMGRLT